MTDTNELDRAEVLARATDGMLKIELLAMLKEAARRGLVIEAQPDKYLLKALLAMLPTRPTRQRPAL